MSIQPTLQDALTEGEALRDVGMGLATMAESPDWKERADRAIAALAREGRPFTAETVRRLVGGPSHPNAFGPRFSSAARRGEIRLVGWRLADRSSLHRCKIGVWIGTGTSHG